MSLEELIEHMKIEKVNHLKDKDSLPTNELSVKANLVELSGAKNDRFKGQGPCWKF